MTESNGGADPAPGRGGITATRPFLRSYSERNRWSGIRDGGHEGCEPGRVMLDPVVAAFGTALVRAIVMK